LANLAVLAFSNLSGEEFLSWGWRIPFALSIVLVAVGLYIRLGILETPVFSRLQEARRVERTPIIEVIRQHPREIVLSALARMAEQAPFYIFTAFVFSYAVTTLKVPRDFVLTAVLVASVFSFITIPLFGPISDRIGRRKTYVRCGADRGVRVRVLCDARQRLAAADFSRHRAVTCSSRHHVWAASCPDRRGVSRAVALQWGVAGIPIGVRDSR